MYSSRDGNSYPQQGYSAQSSYGQNPTSAYPGNSSIARDASSQLGIGSRNTSVVGASHEPDIGGYRGHSSLSGPYGTQYSSLYGTTSVSSVQQVSGLGAKGTGPTALDGRGAYGSVRPHSPKYGSTDYVSSSSLGYTHRSEGLLAEKIPDYASMDRRQYSAYMGRDLPSDATGRYSDSVGYSQHQPEIYDRIDQAVLREQMLKTQSLQSASHDSVIRQADYLAARATTLRHPHQEVDLYGGRVDADPSSISTVGRSSYSTQHNPSILGAAPPRNVDSLLYSKGSTDPGYGVSLPPGRDYGLRKGLHGSALESDFTGGISSRPRINDRKEERAGYTRELELRDEERRRERLREREREREKERERERERERDRERERERERERKRLLELRERERDLQRRRDLEARRERTPLRVSISKDRHASVSLKDGVHRDSPRIGSLHRLHSPVRRREYVCKVNASSLADLERDYLSVDKCYPKLYVSPDFCKLAVNWHRKDLTLSFRTPVSFEHDFVEESLVEKKEPFIKQLDSQTSSSGHLNVWNAKMILMSGLSRNASEELSSERMYDDRIPHVCNLLRFSVLKKDRSYMAIGGPWNPIDGPDPSVDDSSLIQTIIRYARDATQLDLRNCKRWNRFLEIHYDRVGNDGLFTYKEITVFFVPDLSDCLPSLDEWREQWLAHRKVVAERERQLYLLREKERSREKKDDRRGEESATKYEKGADKSDKKKESTGTAQVPESIKIEKDSNSVKGKETEKASEGSVKADVALATENNPERKEVDNTSLQESATPGKKKIVKKVVKKKISAKSSTGGNEIKGVEKVDAGLDNNVKPEVSSQKDGSSADNTNMKTFTRKKVVKKLVDGSPVQNEQKNVGSAVDNENQQDVTQDKSQLKSDSGAAGVVRDGPVKKKIIKKVIKRVPKKKNTTEAVANEVDENKNVDKDAKAEDLSNDGKKAAEDDKSGETNVIYKLQPETKIESSADGVKMEDDSIREKKASGTKRDPDVEKQILPSKDNHDDKRERSKEKINSVNEKDKKGGDGKDEHKRKSSKEVEKKKSEEPPRHPGLIIQTKDCRDSKLRSLSLSLDSLLDYTDKDVEESTFELSLFAESLYEMLQYQMGSRILSFLEKLRKNFVLKRNRRKRQRDEAAGKQKSKGASTKRPKNEVSSRGIESTKTEVDPDDKKCKDGVEKMEVDKEKAVAEDSTKPKQIKEEVDVEGNNEDKEKTKLIKEDEGNNEVREEVDEEEDPEEDPEEEPEEDEEMQEGSPQHDLENVDEEHNDANMEEEKNKAIVEQESNGAIAKPDKDSANAKEENKDVDCEETSVKDTQMKLETSTEACKEKESKGTAPKERAPVRKEVKVDKELLEAFRFFDRNRAGYIRLEDMRLIIHNLGKCLSHRNVKELAQSALLESSTGRDDRILYEKLVRMSGFGKD